jgi:hypothetical protein
MASQRSWLFVVLGAAALLACGGNDRRSPKRHPSADGGSGGSAGIGGDGGSTDAGGGGAGGGLSPATITFTTQLNGTPDNLGFVAAQDGDGAWQALSGNAGVYTFDSQGRFGLAYVCDSRIFPHVLFVQATTADFVSLTRRCFTSGESAVTNVTLAISGLELTDTADFVAGPSYASGAAGSFDLDLKNGTYHFVGARKRQGTHDRVIVHRNVTLSGSPLVLDFDFDVEGEATLLTQVVATNAGGNETLYHANYVTLAGAVPLTLRADPGWVPVAPAALLAAEDRNVIELAAFVDTRAATRYVKVAAKAPQDQSLTLPEPFVTTVTAASQDPLSLWFVFDPLAPGQNVRLEAWQLFGETAVQITADVSAAWLTRGSVGYTTPDLRGLSGWQAAWDFVPGTSVDWNASIAESSTGLSFDEPAPPPADGSVERGAWRFGSFTP